jgi:predicted KAP-like P-loop ATPase
MTEAQHTNDNPIRTPVEDALGIDPFAQVIAHSIRTMQAPEGFVIAINGPWGSGKSSAVNLVTHHLSDARTNGDFDILSFSCWWFRGEEALAISFFNELTAVIGDSIEEAQNILPKLRDKMIQTGPLLQALADSAAPGSGHLMKAITQMLQKSESENETVEQLHDQLRDALARSDKRILVVIDDIDRLSPEEAIQMFRLIKSVGHLPNVIYLLAYDRELAERVVHERFPSEGPHYLEKIVQNVFELPNPRIPDLHSLLLQNVERICQPDISEEAVVHFLNIFHEVVAPEIRTPRDVVRLTNAISVTWSAIAGEVNLGDFVGVEAMRVFQPELYRAIRANKQQLCELPSMSAHRNVEQEAKDADRVLLYGVRESDHLHYRKVIERLFPAMQSVWGNMLYTPE